MKRHRILKDKTGTAAVEFALVSPFLILFFLSIIAYGIYLATSHAVQQVAADAARSAVAGYTQQERERLARDYIARTTMDYAFLDRNAITVKVAGDSANAHQFTVIVEYDAEKLPIWGLYTYMLPQKTITKFSTIRMGGV